MEDKKICIKCGGIIENEDFIEIEGQIYCSEDCANNDGYFKCAGCGDWRHETDLTVGIDEESYCEDCFNDRFIYCQRCGRMEYMEDSIYIDDNGSWYCSEDCAERAGYYRCADCGEWTDETSYVENYGDVCYNCIDRGGYMCCDECNNYYLEDDFYGECEDENGYTEYICNRCHGEMSPHSHGNLIGSYHYFNNWQKMITEKEAQCFRTDNELPLLFGFELEVENKKLDISNNGMAQAIYDYLKNKELKDLLVFENDSSINHGFEIISQPMSYNFIKENTLIFKSILEELNRNGFASHDTSTCGLHIHFSRNKFDKDATSRLLYLFEKCKNELITFSRRKYNELTRWASFMNVDVKDLSLDYIKSVGEDTSRYRAVNLTNNKTIEVRIFRGTLSHVSFMSAIELINNIATMSIECTDSQVINMNFRDIVNFKDTMFLKQYCIDRRIIESEVQR